MGFLTLTGGLEVIEITDTQIRIKNYVASKCYNPTGGLTSRSPAGIDMNEAHFTISEVNKFTLIGCDDVAYIEGFQGRNFTSGCVSVCSDSQDVRTGSCSGSGCCQIAVPKGLKAFDVEMRSMNNHKGVREDTLAFC